MREYMKAIGLVGRLDPMKDHQTFIRAAAQLVEQRKDLRFVCVGDGPTSYRQELIRLCQELNVSEYFMFAGTRENMPAIYNAMDIVVSSSSYGEGFSNAIGEAMACNVPCVVTGVGDSGWILGENGRVVPPKNPRALRKAIGKLLDDLDADGNRGEQIRQRVINNFSVPKLVRATEIVLLSILK